MVLVSCNCQEVSETEASWLKGSSPGLDAVSEVEEERGELETRIDETWSGDSWTTQGGVLSACVLL